MLYLLQAASLESQAPTERVPVAELTAIGFERALLAPQLQLRRQELAKALSRDPAAMTWAAVTARKHLACAADSDDQVITWLAENLVTAIARSLTDEPMHTDTDICKRLPQLAARLAEYESRLTDFDARLEHEKLEAMKELAYGAGHEINNPLANIAARAQTLLKDETHPERARRLAAIHRQAMRAHEMIADLMLFARPPKLKLQPCDVNTVVEHVINGLKEVARERDATIVCGNRAQQFQVCADPTQLGVAIHAVVINALEAIDEGGLVEIEVQATDREGFENARIAVRDNGPGIAEEVRRRMFDPFFSGREAGRGLGFGLSKCWRIVTDHGGQVDVQNWAGGAEVIISLPMADAAA
jgi:signal transduction histidine kinase